jgi:hypothetical protein
MDSMERELHKIIGARFSGTNEGCGSPIGGEIHMKRTFQIGFALVMVLVTALTFGQESADKCRVLDHNAALRFMPDKAPMEMELIPLDTRNISAIEFPDKTRIAVAPLMTAGYSADIQEKYQFIFVTETQVVFDRSRMPAGMVGLGFAGKSERGAPDRILVARDFSGKEIDRMVMKLDSQGSAVPVSLTPKGGKEFELRIGRYVIQGQQR